MSELIRYSTIMPSKILFCKYSGCGQDPTIALRLYAIESDCIMRFTV